MIQEVKVERLRGIREGHLESLTPLTILTGPNGSGKSTMLEAILLGAAPGPAPALALAVQRHAGVRLGAAWLLWKKGSEGPARIHVKTMASTGRQIEILFDPGNEGRQLLQLSPPGSESVYWAEFTDEGEARLSHRPSGMQLTPLDGVPEVRLIEAHDPRPQETLDAVYTRAVEQGRLEAAQAILASIVADLKDLRILSEGGRPVLHLRFSDRSVPAALSGDGVHALTRLSLEMASAPGGLVLLEEPEVHQHPAALRQTARAVGSAVRRGIQVVLTTHSLELVDDLLDDVRESPSVASVFCLRLDAGRLITTRYSGEEAELARFHVEKDLR